MADAEDLGSKTSIKCSEPSCRAKVEDDGRKGCTSLAPLEHVKVGVLMEDAKDNFQG